MRFTANELADMRDTPWDSYSGQLVSLMAEELILLRKLANAVGHVRSGQETVSHIFKTHEAYAAALEFDLEKF